MIHFLVADESHESKNNGGKRMNKFACMKYYFLNVSNCSPAVNNPNSNLAVPTWEWLHTVLVINPLLLHPFNIFTVSNQPSLFKSFQCNVIIRTNGLIIIRKESCIRTLYNMQFIFGYGDNETDLCFYIKNTNIWHAIVVLKLAPTQYKLQVMHVQIDTQMT